METGPQVVPRSLPRHQALFPGNPPKIRSSRLTVQIASCASPGERTATTSEPLLANAPETQRDTGACRRLSLCGATLPSRVLCFLPATRNLRSRSRALHSATKRASTQPIRPEISPPRQLFTSVGNSERTTPTKTRTSRMPSSTCFASPSLGPRKRAFVSRRCQRSKNCALSNTGPTTSSAKKQTPCKTHTCSGNCGRSNEKLTCPPSSPESHSPVDGPVSASQENLFLPERTQPHLASRRHLRPSAFSLSFCRFFPLFIFRLSFFVRLERVAAFVFNFASLSPHCSLALRPSIVKRRGSNAQLGEANSQPETKKLSPGKRETASTDVLCVNTIRCLGADLPTIANSGHPGAPMGMAPMAHALWGYVMRYSGKHPRWFNRDRFILSNGHACALLYSMLHLTARRLRRDNRGSAPVSPAEQQNAGTSRGALRGGHRNDDGNAVGIALAGQYMGAKYNKENFPIFDSHVFVFCGDGCLEEGVASEACSLAGHLGLHRLIVLYDENNITIDGEVNLAFSEKVQQRFKAYDWHVDVVADGNHDVAGLVRTMEAAKKRTDKPTLICVRTTIGFLSSKEGTAKVHGSPLSEDDLRKVKEKCGLNPDEKLQVPDAVKKFYEEVQERGERAVAEWNALFDKYKTAYPEEAKEIERMFSREVRPEVFETLKQLGDKAREKGDSTRAHSGRMLNGIKGFMPELIGGSADLTGSNCTDLQNEKSFQVANRSGRYIHFGVREHAMIAMANGMYHFGCMRPFCATFLNFVTYGWGATRLAALAKCGILLVATHDSIELGQDGPTHQPIEVLALCRATPELIAIRPADGTEVAGAYAVWLRDELKRVTLLSLCRSTVPVLEGSSFDGVALGAYILSDFENNGKKKVVIAGSGSEVHLCVEAKKLLTGNWDVRLVSMPCWTLFDEQPAEYRNKILCLSERKNGNVLTAYVEAASTFGWDKYFDVHVGMQSFGASAPGKALYDFFGFSPASIAKKIEEYKPPF
ncbi:transketolase, related [Neospora caninum Liverpool]|uniref:transketolase n=1 Tax=Neospora caninum (strain Liverpool) TaxID=572307 RepID=F0VAG5_NEOCL|nr:transketolase, related [Neospora caninum Liverpool]CBZ50654.1 transketolase, related [Neospora caninum Liverpool]|eukprot:XP_003880687.1 transketolase, related [Neospora caninum Liverpool]